MKRFFAMFLAFVMIFSFVGCDSSNDETPNKSNDATKEDKNTEKIEDEVEYVVFGSYEQDGNVDNGTEAIQWIPLLEKDGKVMLISRYILEYRAFNESTVAEPTNWEDSSLREWLNDEFLKSAFSSAERDCP